MSHIYSRYLKHQHIPLPDQLRKFVQLNGPCTGAEARHGVARNREAARFIIQDVNSHLNRMSSSGILVREKRKLCSFYTIDTRRFRFREKYRNKQIQNSEKAQKIAKREYKLLREQVKKLPADLRDDVVSEAYLRMLMGLYKGDLNVLIDESLYHVRKEYRGGWKEECTIDGALNDDGFTLLDVLGNESQEDGFVGMYIVERRVDMIQQLISDGYEEDQVSHLWNTSTTTWLKRGKQ